MTISEAFEKLDALRVANALNIEYRLVCNWRDAQAIPAFWRTRFIDVMNKNNVDISLRDLAGWIQQ